MKTLQELIDELTNLIEIGEADGSEMVLFAHQPNYPLQCSIDGPNVVDESEEDIADLHRAIDQEDDDEEKERLHEEMKKLLDKRTKIVYLCEGGWRPRRADGSEIPPYAPRAAWGEY